MKKLYGYAGVVVALSLIVPSLCLGATSFPKQMTLTGIVSRIIGNELTFSTPSAAIYRAQTSNAVLLRKYGAPMAFSEILIGDKVEVTGMVFPDNSVNAVSVKNLSLYAHTGTFTGKIGIVTRATSTFTLESKAYGVQAIKIDGLTVIKKNGSASSLSGMLTGMSASVKGTWERSNKNVEAAEVDGTLRLINISFSGTLVMMGPTGFTVLGANNAIYAVDFGSAKLVSKNNKPIAWGEFKLDDKLTVRGKHISGQLQITATVLKDNSLSK